MALLICLALVALLGGVAGGVAYGKSSAGTTKTETVKLSHETTVQGSVTTITQTQTETETSTETTTVTSGT